MSLRFAILGALVHGPASGYDLVRRFDQKLNFVWWASQAAIYGELPRMLTEDLIRPEAQVGRRGRQLYAITTTGESALRSWLRSVPARQPRDEMMLRVFSLGQLAPEEAASYLDDLAEQYRTRLEEYRRRARTSTEPDAAVDEAEVLDRIALDAGIAHEDAMLRWAQQSAARLRHHHQRSSRD
jgi:DNA-binding PadR family transcriptional regulator